MSAVNQYHAQAFEWPIRVYYEDTDAGGVVYHSQYLNFMERARTEALRSLGFVQTELKVKMGILFVVRALQIQFQKPAVFDDALLVKTEVLSLGRSLLTFRQTIHRDTELLIQATVEVACIDAHKFKPVRIPAQIRDGMQLASGHDNFIDEVKLEN